MSVPTDGTSSGSNEAGTIEVLIAALKDPDWMTSSEAAKALVHHNAEAVAPLIAVLADERAGSEARRRAAHALGTIGDQRATDPLINALRDADGLICFCAAQALGAIGEVTAVEPLFQALKDPFSGVHWAAHRALGHMGESAVPVLVHGLSDADPVVRRSAAYALGCIRDRRAVEPLFEALQDADAAVRASAAEGLGDMGDARAVEPLIQILHDANADVRATAAIALSQLGATEALPALEWMSQNDTGVNWEGDSLKDIAADTIAWITKRQP